MPGDDAALGALRCAYDQYLATSPTAHEYRLAQHAKSTGWQATPWFHLSSKCLEDLSLRHRLFTDGASPFGSMDLLMGGDHRGSLASAVDRKLPPTGVTAGSYAVLAAYGKSGTQVSLPVPRFHLDRGFSEELAELCLSTAAILIKWWNAHGKKAAPGASAPHLMA